MKTRTFDVCVMGQGIGGLIAASVLQKRGAKVLVLTNHHRHLDPQICEFVNGFALKPVLKRVGFHPTEVNAIPALAAPLQLIFPERRLDCFGDERRFEKELAREFHARSNQILQLFKESYGHLEIYQHLFNSRVPLPPKGFFARRQFRKALEQVCDVELIKDRPLEEELKSFDVGDDFLRALQAMELALTGLVSSWSSGARLAHLLTLVRWEGFGPPAGLVTIRDLLYSKLTERGAVIATYDEIKELQVKRKRVIGVVLSGAEWDEVKFSAVVLGGDPRGLIHLSDHGVFRDWKNKLQELPVYARKAFQLFRLKPDGIPVGMQPQGILIPPLAPPEVKERRKRIRALRYVVRKIMRGETQVEMFLGITAFLAPEGEAPEVKKVDLEIRENLFHLIPFMDRHLIEEPKDPFVPSEQGSPGDFRQVLVYHTDKPRLFAVGGFSPETPCPNVFLANDMVFPGLGLDGEIIAGLQSSQFVSAQLFKK